MHRCLASVVVVAPLFAKESAVFTATLQEAYLVGAREAIAAVAAPELMDWLDDHPAVFRGLVASSDPVPAAAVRRLDQMRRALGPERAERYASLLLAVSLGEELPVPAPGKGGDPRVGAAALYLKREGITLLRAREMGDAFFREAELAVPTKKEEAAFWEELAHVSGTYPERVSMTLAEALNLLIDRYETPLGPFASGPAWPLYPIDEAPWPLLAPLKQTLPRSEADYLWARFKGEPPYADGSRWKTYARYSWDYQKVPEVRWKVSPFHPDSIPRIAEDGGVCGRLSSLGQFSCVALGKPAVGMYQPGHRAMLSSHRDAAGLWWAKMEQSVTGPERSHTQWFLPAPDGLRVNATHQVPVKVGVEWHVALHLAMNHGLRPWEDARMALFSARRLRDQDPVTAMRLAEEATVLNPYLLDAWYQLAEWKRGDLREIQALLIRLDQVLSDSGKRAEEHAELAGTTDFNQVRSTRGQADPARDSALVAKVVGASLTGAICGPLLGDKVRRAEAFAFLKRELGRRDKLGKAPDSELGRLLLRFEVAEEGPAGAQKRLGSELEQLFAKNPERREKAADDWLARAAVVAAGMSRAEERVSWFARLQEGLPKELIVKKAKDGRLSADPFFKGLHDLQVKELRALGQAGKADLKRLQQAWASYSERLKP